MPSKVTYLNDELLKLVSAQANALGSTKSAHVVLYTALGGDGQAGTECVAAGYARAPLTGLMGAPGAGTSRRVANNAEVAFAEITAGFTVVGVGIADALSAGNQYYTKTIGSTVIPANTVIRFAIGALTIDEG